MVIATLAGAGYLAWIAAVEGWRAWVVVGLVLLVAGCAALAHWLMGPGPRPGDILPLVLKRLAGLWPYLRPYRGRLALGVAAILVSVGISLVSPLLIGRAIDTLRAEVTREALLGYAALLVLVALGQGVFSYTQRTLLVGMSRDVEYDLLTTYFERLETQPPSFFQRHFTGDLMARATNDLQAVRMLCGPAIMYGSATVLASIGALVLMLRIHPRLTFAALATMPLVALVTKVFGERVHALFEKVQGQFSTVSSQVQESLAGMRVVRAYAQERRQAEAFDRGNREYVERNLPLIRWTAAMHPLLAAPGRHRLRHGALVRRPAGRPRRASPSASSSPSTSSSRGSSGR